MRSSSWGWPPRSELRKDGAGDLAWVRQLGPGPRDRARVLCVELLFWLDSVAEVDLFLRTCARQFALDSVLALVRRHDNATRVALYTSASPAVAHARCDEIRALHRPTAFGVRVTNDPAWAVAKSLATGMEAAVHRRVGEAR